MDEADVAWRVVIQIDEELCIGPFAVDDAVKGSSTPPVVADLSKMVDMSHSPV
jgi:hypothetical protein